jgi:putative endonuclease
MITLKRRAGNKGEDIAAALLKKKGYKILERNFTAKNGEVDIIAQKNKTLVFVEVKLRADDSFGGGLAAVTKAKQQKITKAAIEYIKLRKPDYDGLMFDIITLTGAAARQKAEHLQNAFAVEGYFL